MIDDIKIEGKHKLELRFGNGVTYLNFWDYAHANDVTAEVIDGQLFTMSGDPMTLKEFVNKVRESISKRTV